MSGKRTTAVRFMLLSLLLIFSLLLTACGEEAPADGAPTEEQTSGEVTDGEPSEGEEPVEGEEPSEEEATPEQPTDGQPPTGADGLVADTGFRPETDGFSYQNYGDIGQTPSGETFSVVNLTSVEMRRLFGDEVCAGPANDDGSCTLSPPAEQWMEQNNSSMNGGHCEGFAVMSQMIYAGIVDPNQFGAARTIDLEIKDNELLQRELAYWFTTQGPTWGMQQTLGPGELVQYLTAQYTENPNNIYRLGIMKEDGTGGHAITAYGVQDQGDGTYRILIYDNNYPGQERSMLVDTNAGTWEYEASINPSVEPDVYRGNDSNKVFVADNEPRLTTFPCDFCSSSGVSGKGGNFLAHGTTHYNEIWTEGYVNVELEDDQGRMIGYDKDGKFVNEISEARVQPVLNALSEVPPTIEMPVGMPFTAYIYGDDNAEEIPASLVMIGRGFYIGIDDLVMAEDQLDQLAFDGEGDFLTYTTDAEESPDIIVGIEKEAADFELVLKAVEVSRGTDIHVLFDQTENTFAFEITSDSPAKFSISITRIDENGEEETFDTGDETLDIEPDKFMYFYFGEWEGQGSNLEVGYDESGNGEIEDDEVTNMADAE